MTAPPIRVAAASADDRIAFLPSWISLAGLVAVLCFVTNERLPGGSDATFFWLAALVGATALPLVDPSTALKRWWPYGAFLLFVLARAALENVGAAWLEAARQAAFVTVAMAVATVAAGRRARRMLLVGLVISLALLMPQVLAPGTGTDNAGRAVFYQALWQWGGYPEIGMLAAVGAAGAAGIALSRVSWAARLGCLICAAVFLASMVFIYSRSAIAAALVTLAWMPLARQLSRTGSRTLAVGAAVLLLSGIGMWAVAAASPGTVQARLHPVLSSAALQVRLRGWEAAGAMWSRHPWIGIGPGMYPLRYAEFSRSGDPVHAYNIALHTAAELGTIGAALYLWLWARVLAGSVRGAATAVPGSAGALAVHGMLLAFLIRSQSEHFLANVGSSFRMLLLLAILFGLAEAVRHDSRRAAAVYSPER